MQNEFKIFESEKFGKLRTAVIDGVFWFSGKDVAISLEYKDTDKAIRDHFDVEDKIILKTADLAGLLTDATFSIDTPRGLIFINISSLFSLILSSKLPKARAYRHWVTSKVLPSIHSKGYYISPNAQAAVAVQNQQPVLKSAILANALKNAASIKQTLEEKFNIKDGISSALAISMVEKSDGVELSEVKAVLPAATHEIGRFTPTQIAQKLGLKSAQVVNQLLIEFGLQEKDGNTYILTNEGKKYGEIIPFSNNKNEHSGYRIKWSAAVFSFFEEKGYTLK